jgi:nitroreductase
MDMKYAEKAEKRRSVRRYTDKELTKDQISEIQSFFEKDAKHLNAAIDVELGVFTGDAKNRLEGVAGYKGYALAAPAYLILLSDEDPYYLENAGFIGEDLVLKLTEMGLDTCFLSVRDSDMVKKTLLLDTDKVVAVIIACGYGERKGKDRKLNIRSMSDVSLQEEKSALPKLSQHELVYYENWGTPVDWDAGVVYDDLDNALYAASQAPTYLNKQPYRFILSGKKLLLCLYKPAETPKQELGIDLGAVMLNFFAVYQENINSASEWQMVQGTDDAEDHRIVASFEI